jgi:hypothetical protein
VLQGQKKQHKILNVSKLSQFRNTPENFKGGKVNMFINKWKQITSGKYILNIIETDARVVAINAFIYIFI